MYAEIKAAVDSVKVLSSVLSASKDLRHFNELASAVSELYEKLLRALTAALASKESEAALSERVRLLEQEIIEHKNWDVESKAYALQEIGMGVFAYVYNPAMQTTKPRHWACTTCFENRHIFTLQHFKGYLYKCPHCGTTIEAFKDGQFVSINEAYKTLQGPS